MKDIVIASLVLRLLVLAAIPLGVVAHTAAGPDKVAFPCSYKTHRR
jgi:hypothetical protein